MKKLIIPAIAFACVAIVSFQAMNMLGKKDSENMGGPVAPAMAENTSAPAPIVEASPSAGSPADAPRPAPNMNALKGSGGKSTSSLIKDAPLGGDYVMGNEKAPLTMIEYASLSCPHCAHFSNTVLPELEKKYIQTGKMRYILRQFPLNEPALKGAVLLECVGEQSKEQYYIFSRVLFDAQSKWAFDGNYMAGLETIASVGGLTHDQFMSCLNNTDREMRVLKIKQLANEELKVPHTPYFYIGSDVYEGDKSVEAMSAFIDAKLAGKQ